MPREGLLEAVVSYTFNLNRRIDVPPKCGTRMVNHFADAEVKGGTMCTDTHAPTHHYCPTASSSSSFTPLVLQPRTHLHCSNSQEFNTGLVSCDGEQRAALACSPRRQQGGGGGGGEAQTWSPRKQQARGHRRVGPAFRTPGLLPARSLASSLPTTGDGREGAG